MFCLLLKKSSFEIMFEKKGKKNSKKNTQPIIMKKNIRNSNRKKYLEFDSLLDYMTGKKINITNLLVITIGKARKKKFLIKK